jgi:hypothetical protein
MESRPAMYHNGIEDFLLPGTIYSIYRMDGKFDYYRVCADGKSQPMSKEEYKRAVDEAKQDRLPC